MAVGYSLRLRLSEEIYIASSARARRIVARSVFEQAREHCLLTFRAAGPYLELIVLCDRPTAGELARRVEITLSRRLDLPVSFERARIQDLRDQWHLVSTFRLVLRKGDDGDPLHEASNLPDLLGLRVIGQYTAENLRARLPRVKRQELLGYLGVSDLRCGSPSLDHHVVSAEAAAGLPELKARSREAIAAKTALVAVLQGHLTTNQMASVLSISEATVKRLRRREADPLLVTAILMQMHLRRLVGERQSR